MQSNMDLRIKYRELFWSFAPVVLVRTCWRLFWDR